MITRAPNCSARTAPNLAYKSNVRLSVLHGEEVVLAFDTF